MASPPLPDQPPRLRRSSPSSSLPALIDAVGVYATLGEVNVIDQPVNMSRTPPQMRRATPECGEHTDEVLTDAGYTSDQIAEMRNRNVI